MRALGARFTSAVRQDSGVMDVPCTDRRDRHCTGSTHREPRNVRDHYWGYQECGR